MRKWRIFQVVDATDRVVMSIGSWEDYEPQFRKHVAWWKRYARSSEYRAKVPSWQWPVFPVNIQIEDAP